MSASASIPRPSRSKPPATPALTAFVFVGLVMVAVRTPRSPRQADVVIGRGVDVGRATVLSSLLTSLDDLAERHIAVGGRFSGHAEQPFTHDVALHLVG